jgi:hypothetical protein
VQFPISTWVRWILGGFTTVAFLSLGAFFLDKEPRLGALALAFGVLRGGLVARQIYGEVTGSAYEPPPPLDDRAPLEEAPRE